MNSEAQDQAVISNGNGSGTGSEQQGAPSYVPGMILQAVIRFRPEWRGQVVRDSLKALTGRRVFVQVAEDQSSIYPGEYVLTPFDEDSRHLLYQNGLFWIASGDVQVLRVVNQEASD